MTRKHLIGIITYAKLNAGLDKSTVDEVIYNLELDAYLAGMSINDYVEYAAETGKLPFAHDPEPSVILNEWL